MQSDFLGECSHPCPPKCKSVVGESGICASTNTLNCSTFNGTVTNVHNQTFCIFTGVSNSGTCSTIGGDFIECSLMNPYQCFSCEHVRRVFFYEVILRVLMTARLLWDHFAFLIPTYNAKVKESVKEPLELVLTLSF